MPRANSSKTELFIRVSLTLIVIFNAVIPTAALAMPSVSDESTMPQTGIANNPLSATEPVYYQPDPALPNPSRFSPEADEEKPVAPEKDDIEFSISTSKGEVDTSRTITINALIRNNTKSQVNNLTYSDKLESGFEFDSSTDKLVEIDSKAKTVTYSIQSINAGEEVGFSYTLDIQNVKTGKLSIHNAEIEYEFNKETRAQTASLGFVDTSTVIDSNALIVVPDQAGDGWETVDRYSLYLGEEVLSQAAIVSITPADIPGDNSPALQFNLDLIQTAVPMTSGGEGLDEQVIDLTQVVETSFDSPAYLEINLDGYFDLENIPAGLEPYVATYYEELDIWVKVPVLETNLLANTIIVKTDHFSTWGAGLGSSLPQNGANVLLFDQPYTSLFTGAASYSLPIWTLPGRAGMSPDVSLSYSSSTVDGVLGDVQAPWTGVGWNIDGVEIVRKITTNDDGYGYENDFALTLNGAMYELERDVDDESATRYHTDHDAFLYIERHNSALGNQNYFEEDDDYSGPDPNNTTGEWWEVVTTDGTRYRLGWNDDSEQLALMYGYKCTLDCTTPDQPYSVMGYAGKAQNLVALRWRVDKVTDTYGNYIEYIYHEEHALGQNAVAQFDRGSYIKDILYTGFDSSDGNSDLEPGYKIHFVNASRSAIGDVPNTFNVWDNADFQLLDKIEISCTTAACGENHDHIVRTYDFGYSLATVPNANGTLMLTSVAVTGSDGTTEISAPTIRFTYQNKDNRVVSGSDNKYTYPRLTSINNGAGGTLSYVYEHDGRGTNSWYNYRVKEVHLQSGLETAARHSYTYETALYTGPGSLGELIGYTTTTENQLDYKNNNSTILATKHTFGTSGLDTGRELKTEWLDGSTVLRKVTNTYVTDNSQAPYLGWNFRYLYSTHKYEGGTLASKVFYIKDPGTGNLLSQIEYLGSSVYRKTYYEYWTGGISKHILDKVSRTYLVNSSNEAFGDIRLFYNDEGDVLVTEQLTGVGNATVDSQVDYDEYGNTNAVYAPLDGTQNGTYSGSTANIISTTTYDEKFHTYPLETKNALDQITKSNYIYELGLPSSITDPNNWITTTTYDGLGRTLSVHAPGLPQAGVLYNYPVVSSNGYLSPPYAVEMQILDAAKAPQYNYRSVWGIYDGLGRMIQTQVYDDVEHETIVSDSFYNAQGLAYEQSLPYPSNQPEGHHIFPSGTQSTITTFDKLGRPLTMTQPGGIVTTTSYDGLSVTVMGPDQPNRNIVKRISDGLGRLISVQEFSDQNTVYATTLYTYDRTDRLTNVLDAQGNETIIKYDWLGRKTEMDDPDMGVWTYQYFPSGTLKKQTDARGKVLNFTYDDLNRPLTKTGTDNVSVSYQYGTTAGVGGNGNGDIGMRIRMTDGSGSTAWSYSNYGRTITEEKIIGIGSDEQSLITTTDWLGRPLSVTYPDAETLTYTYDALGRPDQVSSGGTTLVDLAYTVLGQISEQTLGNGVLITNSYDSANRLDTHIAMKDSTELMNFSYDYDQAGNIDILTDVKLNETHNYTYDFLNRLKTANAHTTDTPGNIQYDQQFEYDKVGNILQFNDWIIPQTNLGPQLAAAPASADKSVVYEPAQEQPDLEIVSANDSVLAAPLHDPTSWYTPTGYTSNSGVTNAGNVYTSNNSRATFDSENDVVQYTAFDISSVPSGATIDGIEVTIEGYTADTRNVQVSLSWNGGTTFTSVKTTTLPGTTSVLEGTIVLGGPSDNWGRTWSDTEFTDTNFIAKVQGTSASTLSAYIDQLQVKVHYTPVGITNTPTLTPSPTLAPTLISPNAPVVATPTPTFDGNVHTLLHMEGLDESVDFVDEASKIWTAFGNAQIDITESKFGDASALFDGTGDYIQTADNSDFDLGSGNFTIDTWFKKAALDANYVIAGQATSSGSAASTSFILYANGDGSDDHPRAHVYSGTNVYAIESSTAVTDTNWHHLALVRSGSTMTLYLDGTNVGITNLGSYIINNSSGKLSVGRRGEYNDGQDMNGWIDEFRFSKGIVRWSSNFTPPSNPYGGLYTPTPTPSNTPTPTSTANTATPTQLFGNMTGYWDFQSGSDVSPYDTFDNSATLTGVTTETNSIHGSSAYFNGSSTSYAEVADHAEIENNGSFTLSAWINPSAIVTTGDQYIVRKSGDYGFITVSTPAGTATPTPNPNVLANGRLVFEIPDLTPSQLDGPILPVNTWSLVTGVYDASANEMRLYLNGEMIASQSVTGTVTMNNSNKLYFSSNTARHYHGRLDEVKFYKGAVSSSQVSSLYSTAIPTSTATPTGTITFTPTSTPSLAPTATIPATPLPVGALQWGTGEDGDLIIDGSSRPGYTYSDIDYATFNLNSNTNGYMGRTCADGIAYNVTQLGSTVAVLDSVVNSTATSTPTPTSTTTPLPPLDPTCLAEGDEVLLIQLTDSTWSKYNSGSYEFLRVDSVIGNEVAFTTAKTKWYGNGWRSDSNIGTGSGQYRVMLIRVPNYDDVTVDGTVNGTLKASPFDGSKYGMVVFRVNGVLSGTGSINANSLGFTNSTGYGHGGIGAENKDGGGAGYGTSGTAANNSGGSAGGTYGFPQLNSLFLGSGGGASGQRNNGTEIYPAQVGGKSGGIILIMGNTVNFTGSITSNGNTGNNANGVYGGAGSGGSIRIEGYSITLDSITANGGVGDEDAGDGGKGRIALYYQSEEEPSVTTSSPSFYEARLGQTATDTPAPTAIDLISTPSPWGNGEDGSLVVATATTLNISTTNSGTHNCVGAGDGAGYTIATLSDSWAKLSTTPGANCLNPGDEIVLLHTSGGGPNKGNYEFLRVGGVVGDTVYFTHSKAKYYGSNVDDDSNVGGSQIVILQRVPNYDDVTVNGTLKASSRLIFRVSGELKGSGIISTNGGGFGSAAGYAYGGTGTTNKDGGGAGYGENGTAAINGGGSGGGTYGPLELGTLFYGSGGGASGIRDTGSNTYPAQPGGSGGGIILIIANTIDFGSGSITSNGNPGADANGVYGGGGSGGSIRIEGNDVTLGTLTVNGATGNGDAGDGGKGRIAIYYITTPLTGGPSSNLYTHIQQVSTSPTATPTPVPTSALGVDSYVKGMLHMDGTDASPTITDTTGRVWSANGNAQIDTAQSKFGGSSGSFDGTGDYLTTADSADFDFGTGDFTIDFWVRFNSTSGRQDFINQFVSGPTAITIHKVATSNKLRMYFYNGSIKGDYIMTNNWSPNANQWYHLAFVRSGSSGYIFIDGVPQAVTQSTAFGTLGGGNSLVYVGGDGLNNQQYLNGWLDELRISKGIARWASNFVPPSSPYSSQYVTTTTPTALPTAQWVEKTYSYSATVTRASLADPTPHAVTIAHAVSSVDDGGATSSYQYDANGNMTCRTEAGITYLQTYNLENRIASIGKLASGNCATIPPVYASKWDFGYDGDGVRTSTLYTPYVSGAPQTAVLTAYYFGGTYEVTGSDVTKYYSFGGQTIMRDANGLQYFLTDHLGSTVAITEATDTDSNGTLLVSQQRYLPFGQVRTDIDSITETDFGYTGQRLLDVDEDASGPDQGMGGLMDYKARFYSPYINHFLQPDTITPGGPQGLNRYSYALNNPIRYNDPTGHLACEDDDGPDTCKHNTIKEELFRDYGVRIDKEFNTKHRRAIMAAVKAVGAKLASQEGGTAQSAFRNAYSRGVNFTFGSGPAGGVDHPNAGPGCAGVTQGGCTTSPTQIDFWTMAGDGDSYGNELTRDIYNVVHELGHAYDYGHNYPSSAIPSAFAEVRNRYLRPNGIDNYPGPGQFTQQDDYLNLQQNRSTTQGETYGDMFVAWVFDKWNTNPDNAIYVSTAQGYMP